MLSSISDPVLFLFSAIAKYSAIGSLSYNFSSALTISIHALREEGDPESRPNEPGNVLISIHALREEGDKINLNGLVRMRFLSTPSARRATVHEEGIHGYCQISIHALREEGDPPERSLERVSAISIYALREEGDASPF